MGVPIYIPPNNKKKKWFHHTCAINTKIVSKFFNIFYLMEISTHFLFTKTQQMTFHIPWYLHIMLLCFHLGLSSKIIGQFVIVSSYCFQCHLYPS